MEVDLFTINLYLAMFLQRSCWVRYHFKKWWLKAVSLPTEM